ncbi:MAG: hypothetical protein GAK29_02485 [Acinetobacter bereziniae]|uniref:Uncharacterized protein n=1 Tax=Acinetobacter bereziniae TaxID=106648 RepID=A0A833PF35_ACIBZ|nr:MAG: hypothetical protein GAK29_02485 [Acinetobacter bereziniae]
MFNDLLLPMFDDEYYPDILVAEIKQLIEKFAKKVARTSFSDAEIYSLANLTVIEINEMKPQFEDLDSSLDDTAADYIAEALMMVVQDQGYLDLEMEELVANRVVNHSLFLYMRLKISKMMKRIAIQLSVKSRPS